MNIPTDVRARLVLAAAKEAITAISPENRAHDLLAQIIAQANAMIGTSDRPADVNSPLGANVVPFRRAV